MYGKFLQLPFIITWYKKGKLFSELPFEMVEIIISFLSEDNLHINILEYIKILYRSSRRNLNLEFKQQMWYKKNYIDTFYNINKIFKVQITRMEILKTVNIGEWTPSGLTKYTLQYICDPENKGKFSFLDLEKRNEVVRIKEWEFFSDCSDSLMINTPEYFRYNNIDRKMQTLGWFYLDENMQMGNDLEIVDKLCSYATSASIVIFRNVASEKNKICSKLYSIRISNKKILERLL